MDPEILDHFKKTLDYLSDPGNNPEPPAVPPPPCSICKMTWFCTWPCPTKPLKPFTPDPTWNSRKEQMQDVDDEVADSAQSTKSRSPPPRRRQNEKQQLPGRKWEQVGALLTQKVLALPRTRQVVEQILTDHRISMNPCSNTFVIPHCRSVIAELPSTNRFKIGLTIDPDHRFYTASYSYNRKYIQEKDGVQYSNMIIVYVSHSRDVIAMLEHSLILYFKEHNPRRCANRKIDVDINRQENSDSEDERKSDGPFFAYVVHGAPG